MKRRICDEDEMAFYWLSRVCAPVERYRLDRPLNYVHVIDGWAFSSDAVRLLALPVSMDDGAIPAHEAMAGGSVSVRRDMGGERLLGFTKRIGPVKVNASATLDQRALDALHPWTRRKPAYGEGIATTTLAWFRPALIVGGDPVMILPDRSWHYTNGHLLAAVQAPLLASLTAPIASLGDGSVTVTGSGLGPLAITNDEAPIEAGWATVMPCRTDFTQAPEIGRKHR